MPGQADLATRPPVASVTKRAAAAPQPLPLAELSAEEDTVVVSVVGLLTSHGIDAAAWPGAEYRFGALEADAASSAVTAPCS